MANVGSLGDIDFHVRSSYGKNQVLSFHDLTRNTSANFAEHERNGGKPYLEYSGPGLDEVSLIIEADAQLGVNPLEIQAALHKYAEDGTPNMLVVGGKKIGDNPFVIVAISDIYKRFYTNGKPTAISMQITLKEYANQVARITTIPSARQIGAGQAGTGPIKTYYDTYVVVKGDCLWNISKKFYGAGRQYTKIYNANTDIIKNPNLIYPGQVLKIPR